MKKKYIFLFFNGLYKLLLLSIFSFNLHAQSTGDQLDLARKAYASNSFDKAASHLDLILQEKPNSDEVYFFKGKCKVELDLYNDALDSFTNASNIDPHEPEYYYYKGMCEWKLKRTQSAIVSVEKSLLYNPNNFLAYRLLGCIYYELNMIPKAKSYFDKAMEKRPDFNSNVFTKSKVEDNLEAYKVTMRASNRDSKSQPTNAIPKFYLGVLKTIGRDDWGAYIDFTTVAEIDPELAVNYYYKGYVEFNINKIKEALDDLNKYTSKFPEDKVAISFLKIVKDASKFKSSANAVAEDLLIVAEEMPEFIGGSLGVQKFIGDNIRYPSAALNQRLQGRVVVSFTVDSDGFIKDMEVLKGIGGGCEAEALRVVSLMPNWKPGKQGGKNVSVKYVLPIKFALAE